MKKKIGMFLFLIGGLLFAGCSKEEKGIATNIYYMNPEGNALVQEVYFRQETDGEKAVKEIFEVLTKPTDLQEFQSAIPQTIKIEGVGLEKQKLEVSFNNEYGKLAKSTEVLMRAAIVQTMVQIPDVTYVSFYVGKEPLKDTSGEAIGLMCAEDFVQNTGFSLKTYQETDLKLYFADKEGMKLVAEKHEGVHYNINTSIEKLVVEQLMKGSRSDKRSGTIPDTVKLLGVSVKDGICYVNFDSAFLTEGFNQKPEVAIYSIVNSIIANGNTTKVQILVDGSADVSFKGTIDLSEPLEWRADLIEE